MKEKMYTREPEFMKELHRVRARLARKWSRMTNAEIVKSINESGKWLKAQIASGSEKV